MFKITFIIGKVKAKYVIYNCLSIRYLYVMYMLSTYIYNNFLMYCEFAYIINPDLKIDDHMDHNNNHIDNHIMLKINNKSVLC